MGTVVSVTTTIVKARVLMDDDAVHPLVALLLLRVKCLPHGSPITQGTSLHDYLISCFLKVFFKFPAVYFFISFFLRTFATYCDNKHQRYIVWCRDTNVEPFNIFANEVKNDSGAVKYHKAPNDSAFL